MDASGDDFIPIDTSEVDKRLGKPSGGPQLKEPVVTQDIRAWVQAMHNPNPLHFDEEFAARTKFGRIVAPQSFDIACEHNQGVIPALDGQIDGAHELWGGAEWSFYGPRIYPGDRVTCVRTPFDYKLTTTRFAGPTLFQRGDTEFFNQRGELVSRLRTTAVRYLVENAQRIGAHTSSPDGAEDVDWSDEDRERIEEEKQTYYRSFRERPVRAGSEIAAGEQLPRGVLGPHSVATFTTDWRAYLWNRGWGSSVVDPNRPYLPEKGFSAAVSMNRERARLDPAQLDLVYHGPARGHLDRRIARKIGMPRPYAFGTSMNAWVLDYVANWAGQHGYIVHSTYNARGPALSGDVTYLHGTVKSVAASPDVQDHVVATVEVKLTGNPGDRSLGVATVNVRFPSHVADAARPGGTNHGGN